MALKLPFNFGAPNAKSRLEHMACPQICWASTFWIAFVMIQSGWCAAPQGELLTKEGKVEATGKLTNWMPAEVGLKLAVFDRLRTLALSRATVRLAELGRLRVDELTTMEILPPTQSAGKGIIDLKAGAVYIFTRDKPREFLLQTPHAIGASRGTEFVVEVDPAGRTVVTVFDGEVELYNPQGSVTLTNGSQGTVLPGQAPVMTAVIQATSVVQWWLYYPGVIDPDELSFTLAEETALANSLSAYRSGDLLQALTNYPAGRVATSDAERIYRAGLLLAVGQVDKAETELNAVPAASPLSVALRTVIVAVTGRGAVKPDKGATASEWLAQSYLQQPTNLETSLALARAAVEKSPRFGFAWARVAELEFSFGRLNATDRALRKALELSPRNAQALALRGFVLAAQNRISEAQQVFEEALSIDGALGNAWLGRGLCRIRQGDTEGGRADIQTAAALEPNRSLLRSYLGKAFDQVHDDFHAFKELELAKRLDTNDPTPWLYSALIDYERNRINDAVRSLEKSVELNDNRHIYRSELLLDQDRAVRSASLATIYQRAGLSEVSVREAARAVIDDYGNYSAHLFLANSFDAFRDPTRFNLRYETAWFNELLLANLLAPVGAGTFSQNISQQEYSRLFERNRLGLVTTTDVRSDAQYREVASQFGTFGNTSYSLDLDYQRNEGVRPNNELTRIEWYTQIKQQLTAQDSIFLLAKYQDYHSGDNFQYYDPTNARRDFSFDDSQTPIVVGGYHREWAPGVHTLFLAGRLVSELKQHGAERLEVISTNANLDLVMSRSPFDVDYESQFEIFTSELNQIFQTEHATTIVGGRF
ncbi:MAG TPA: FecR domain-containing protein, partial [Verrucomicrobiae bacterium]|nr:FecR domain-containing protein [Verrucomicrobiae bacterium]